MFAIFEMERGCGPSEQSQPLALEGDHVAHLLPDQIGVSEIVVFADRLVPSLDFVRKDYAMRLQLIQDGRLFVFWQ